jgi:hypothetical protein
MKNPWRKLNSKVVHKNAHKIFEDAAIIGIFKAIEYLKNNK